MLEFHKTVINLECDIHLKHFLGDRTVSPFEDSSFCGDPSLQHKNARECPWRCLVRSVPEGVSKQEIACQQRLDSVHADFEISSCLSIHIAVENPVFQPEPICMVQAIGEEPEGLIA